MSRYPAALLALLIVAACGGPAADAPAAAPKLLLVGIDGVRVDVLSEVETPSFDALAAEGALWTGARTTTPSVSGPAWSSMLTGVWPDKHGVVDNEFTGDRYDDFPDFLTRIERARPELTTVAIADWPPLVTREGGRPTISNEVDVVHALDGYADGWAEADSVGTALAVRALEESDPDALFLYLGNPDETSHGTASIGEEYRRSIGVADSQLGMVVDAVRRRATYASERWLVLVSTDHGRRGDGGHGGDSPEEMTIFVLVHGAGARPAGPAASGERPVSIVDVAATALDHLGIAIPADQALDGTPLSLGPAPAR